MTIKLRLCVCNLRIVSLVDFAEKQTPYTGQTILRKIPFLFSDFPLGITGAIDLFLGDRVPESSIKCLYWPLSSSGLTYWVWGPLQGKCRKRETQRNRCLQSEGTRTPHCHV